MSSVNNNDEVRKLREYYEKREEELKAKQAREKQKLSEVQEANLKKVSKDSDALAQQQREGTRASITSNDMKHANDIERLKSFHVKQMREQMDRQATEDRVLKKNYKENLERIENRSKAELAAKDERNLKLVKDNAQNTEQIIQSYGQKNKDETAEVKQNLSKKYAEKEKFMQDQQNAERASTLAKHSAYKDHKERESARVQNENSQQQGKIQSTYKKLIAQKEEDNQHLVEDMRELHIDGVDRERRQYDKALKQERANMMNAHQELKERGEGAKKVAELQKKIADLEKQNLRNQNKMERAKKREVEHVKLAYQDNLELMQEQKTGIVKESNKSKSDQILELQRKADEQVKTSRDYFQSRLEQEAEHHDENVTRLQKRLNRDNAQKNSMADLRFKKLKEDTAHEQAAQAKNQQASLNLAKGEHEYTLQQERKEKDNQVKIMKNSYEDRIMKMQLSQNEEIAKLKSQHDAMVAQLRSEFQDQNIELQGKLKTVAAEKEKTRDQEVKAKESQFEYRLSKMEEAYRDSLKKLNKQHEESVRMVNGKDGKGRYA